MTTRPEDMNFQPGRGGMYFSVTVVLVPVTAFALMISCAYRKRRSLFSEIARRIPVEIGIHGHTYNLLQDRQ